MTPPRDRPRGTYLQTGWRVVGQDLLALTQRTAAAAPAREPLALGGAADPLYTLACTLGPADSGRQAVEAVLDAVTDEVRATWSECPRLVRDQDVDRPASRFGGVRYRMRAKPGEAWMGDLVWRSAHPTVPGAPITTRVLLEEQKHFTRLHVRVSADEGIASVRGYLGAGQAQPAFVHALPQSVPVTWMGAELRIHHLRAGDIEDFVQSTLANPARALPIVVLSPLEEGGFVVEPEQLVRDLLGRARLHVIDQHPQTFELSDTVGDRRMSCFRGAARCYLPGWSPHDDPFEHPLLIGERLADPVMRAQWLGEIGLWMASGFELPRLLDEERTVSPGPVDASPSVSTGSAPEPDDAPSTPGASAAALPAPAQRGPAPTSRRADVPVDPGEPPTFADPTGPIERLMGEFATVAAALDRLLESNHALSDEVARLRTIAAVRSSSTNAIERRLARLEELMEEFFGRAAPGADGPAAEAASVSEPAPERDEGQLSLVDVVRDVAELHGDALIVLDSALRAAGESPYEDPERVRALLDAMAHVSRKRQDGTLGMSLREAFSDLGVDYRGAIAKSTPARLREQYRFVTPTGEAFEAVEHIVLGNTYDPRRCLRIYFSSRVNQEARFVVGHVGRHFEVLTST